jgi:hypothetical protein
MAIAADLFVDVLSDDGRRPLMWLSVRKNRMGVDRFGNSHALDLSYGARQDPSQH